MRRVKGTKLRKRFNELRKQVDADPARRSRVEKHKTAMLAGRHPGQDDHIVPVRGVRSID